MRTSAAQLNLWQRVRAAWRRPLAVEWLYLGLALYFATVCNLAFWQRLASLSVEGRPWLTWLSLFVAMVLLHALLFALLLPRVLGKAAAVVLLLLTAGAAYYMQTYQVFLDDDMLRNVLHSDWKEARELITPGLLLWLLLVAGVPALGVASLELRAFPLSVALRRRALFVVVCGSVAGCALWLQAPALSGLLRTHKELRELIAPGNYLVSLYRVGRHAWKQAHARHEYIGDDAVFMPRPAHSRPRMLVLVIGETVRAQDWGLNGYVRQTTPELAAVPLFNFSRVHACGTSTEVSLPCLLSAPGIHAYDRDRIENSESLLHLLDKIGVATLWRDNQTGCKGTCSGLPFESFETGHGGPGCTAAGCFDEALIADLARLDRSHRGDFVLVVHPLGSHGPSYFRRYPAEFARFQPECRSDDLSACSVESIRNAYDNSILYADHVLATAIAELDGSAIHDTALLFVADHGESLGEGGLYLHGVPAAVAPAEQTEVPLLLWLSAPLQRALTLESECLHRATSRAIDHDAVFHTVLGLFGISTQEYLPHYDLLAGCRRLG